MQHLKGHATQKWKSVTIYSPSCCFKPIEFWLIFRIQIRLFLIKLETSIPPPKVQETKTSIHVSLSFIKNILICVSKINQSLMSKYQILFIYSYILLKVEL